jgi:hypothetical protein
VNKRSESRNTKIIKKMNHGSNKRKRSCWTNGEINIIAEELINNNYKSTSCLLSNLEGKLNKYGSTRTISSISGRVNAIKHSHNLTKKAKRNTEVVVTEEVVAEEVVAEVKAAAVEPTPAEVVVEAAAEVEPLPPTPQADEKLAIKTILEELLQIGISNLSINLKQDFYEIKHKDLEILFQKLF